MPNPSERIIAGQRKLYHDTTDRLVGLAFASFEGASAFVKRETDGKNIVTLHGRMGAKQRHQRMTTLQQIPDGTERVLIATGRYLGEGFDDARLDTLFLTMPVSWKGTLAQYAGRLHRLHPSKVEVVIYDYVDGCEPVLAHLAAKRRAGHRSLGYEAMEHADTHNAQLIPSP